MIQGPVHHDWTFSILRAGKTAFRSLSCVKRPCAVLAISRQRPYRRSIRLRGDVGAQWVRLEHPPARSTVVVRPGSCSWARTQRGTASFDGARALGLDLLREAVCLEVAVILVPDGV